ncbi:folate-binding protein YgfZ [Roseovarius sp. EL26]|uniref:CAF17-like 4Fe-4S cluster assembly/insertion protein YgfZ n=1 Tax=Roseovarius sp. EL26 TaxID=2126672 RepID=UPI000EA18BE6|nr:folate-binding protein YgfZ [Roseovarius sp. EL26]
MTRTILKVSGKDAHAFLQGLVTNDVDKLKQGLVYAALLTPQGKYLADFLMYQRDDGIFLDADSALAPSLMQRLTMYRLRADVQISETELTVRRGTGPAPEGALPDPRHAELGWRLYGTQSGDDGTDWDAIRVAHCIPDTGIELTPDSYILESGFERLNGVDFKKGCYVGQEVTARMKHKTELRKGLATIRITGTAPTGTDVIASGKTIGTLFTQSGDQAIAYLRFDRVNDNMQAGDATLHKA